MFLEQDNFQMALAKLESARAHCPDKANKVRELTVVVFEAIEEKKVEAEQARIASQIAEARLSLNDDPKRSHAILSGILAELPDHSEARSLLKQAQKKPFYAQKYDDKVPSPILSIAISDNGRLMIAGHENGKLSAWDLHTDSLIADLHLKGAIYDVVFVDDTSMLCSVGKNGRIDKLVFRANKLSSKALYSHHSRILSLERVKTYLPDPGQYFLMADEKGEVHSLSGSSLTLVDSFDTIIRNLQIIDMQSLTFVDTSLAEAHQFEETYLLFSTANGRYVTTKSTYFNDTIPGNDIINRRMLANGFREESERDSMNIEMGFERLTKLDLVSAVQIFYWDKELYYILGDINGVVEIVDKANTPYRNFSAHNGPIYTVETYGEKIITGGGDHKIKIWNPTTLGDPLILSGHYGSIIDLDIWKNWLFSSGADGTITRWDLSNL